jgi:hypothetical protein
MTQRPRNVRGVWVALLACLPLAGCVTRVSNAAPPTVICGTTLSSSAAGPVVYDLRGGDQTEIRMTTVGGVIFLRLTGCGRGADVTIVPPTAAEIVDVASARDGKPAAIVLRPVQLVPTTVEARQQGHTIGSARIVLDQLPP